MKKVFFLLSLLPVFSFAQIAYRNALGSNNAGGGTTITMNIPSGVVNGDFLVMVVDQATANTTSSVSGWNYYFDGVTTTGFGQSIFFRVASNEPSNYVVTLGGGTAKASGVIIAISGTTTTGIVGNRSNKVNASSATINTDAIGVTFNGSLINGIDLFLGGTQTGTTAASPSTYTLAAQSASTGGGAGSRTTTGVSYKYYSQVSLIGAISATYGAAAVNIGSHIFIEEAPKGRGRFFKLFTP